ncbi:hypothetical protein QAD02_003472 [Eretmocerus hayati]|uniref:Uncharacterized protein n=1 Tax=Eretmocerus hayati TaxID=131215 RepID=A0ACC2NN24_9HYME|nr:hypothetical protein QAD02_003472 [Eretmocerus hayati]
MYDEEDRRRRRKSLSMKFARKVKSIPGQSTSNTGVTAEDGNSDCTAPQKLKLDEESGNTNPVISGGNDFVMIPKEVLPNDSGPCSQVGGNHQAVMNIRSANINSPLQSIIVQSVDADDVQESDSSAWPSSASPVPTQNTTNIFIGNDDSDEEEGLVVSKDSILADMIKEWALENHVAFMTVDKLLQKVKPHFPDIPASHKTLLDRGSQPMFEVRKFDPCNESDELQFVHFGLKRILEIIIRASLHTANPVIELKFNADGSKLKKSSAIEFWALQGQIHTDDTITYDPFLISVWYGKGKPSSPDLFVQDFVTDLNHLLVEGLTVDGVKLEIRVHCSICDWPARAFLKRITGHTGFFCYERCHIAGCKPRSTTIFPYSKCPPRTMLSFNWRLDQFHHKGSLLSPLLAIKSPPDHRPMDLVKLFILDFMHLGPLTNMEIMLLNWTSETRLKLSQQDIDKICKRMEAISKQIPEEFQRSTRSLEILSSWKATESRFFLLYCGFLVVKDILPAEVYEHFCLFAVSSRILSSDELIEKYLPLAEAYLDKCAELFPVIYGEDSETLYAHSLMHIADDVKEMKCNICRLTAFPVENNMKKVKYWLRSAYKSLRQLCFQVYTDEIFLSKEKSGEGKVMIDSVMFRHCKLSCKSSNNMIMMSNGDVVRIVQLFHESSSSEEVFFKGKKLAIVGDVFTYPMQSSSLGILEINDTVTEIISSSLENMTAKLVLLSIDGESTRSRNDHVVPFLH